MNRKLLISGILIFVSATIFAFANRKVVMRMLHHKEAASAVVNVPKPEPKYDPALLSKLNEIIKTFAGQRHAYTLAGTVNLINKADTSEKMDHVQFFAEQK